MHAVSSSTKKSTIARLPIALVLGCFALGHNARAVSPAPDGGYAGNNTAEGTNALFKLTMGVNNTALGYQGLFNTTTGSNNTAVGLQSLFSNTGGGNNTANGYRALLSNTTGAKNTAVGTNALRLNTTGSNNTANGMFALNSNTTASYNTANGANALYSNMTGAGNTANGFQALFSNTTGLYNTANGYQALYSNTTGYFNTATGLQALYSNTTGGYNTAVGNLAGNGVTTANNVIVIGASGANVSNSCFIGNVRGVTTAKANAIPVLIDSAGQLGTTSSSRRFKKEIKPMDSASEAILALKPVSFHYKRDSTATAQFGLIAEEVAEVNPDLVVRDEKGEIYTVRYDAVNAMLLNEFLKEHHKVKEQEASIAELKSTTTKQQELMAQQQKDFQSAIAQQRKEIAELVTRLKEQEAKIQKVIARFELDRTASEMVVNNQ